MLRRKKGAWIGYYFNSRDDTGKRREIPLGSNLDEALASYSRLVAEQVGARQAQVPQIGMDEQETRIFLQALLARTKQRAKASNIECTLTIADLYSLLEQCNGTCALSGIPFTEKEIPGKRFRPWMPSVDRIQSSGPYSLENCRLVSAYVNIAMNQFGEKLLVYVARAIAKKQVENEMNTLFV